MSTELDEVIAGERAELATRVREASGKGWRPDVLGEDGPGGVGSRAMVKVLWAYRRTFAVTVASGFGQQALQIVAAVLSAQVTGLALTGVSATELWPWLIVLLGLVLARAVLVWVEAWVGHDLSFRMLAEVRMWLYRAFDRMGPAGLARHRSGDLVTRTMSDSEGLEVFYAHTAVHLAVGAVLSPLIVAAMWIVQPVLALVLLPFMVLAASVPMWLRRANERHGAALRERTADVNVDVVDVITGLREVLSFGQGERRRVRLRQVAADLAHAEVRQGSRGGFELAVVGVIVGLGGLAVLLVAARLTLAGSLPVTAFAPVVVLGISGFAPILLVLNVTRVTGITTASARRVFDLLDEPATVPDTGTADRPEAAREDTGVRFTDVRFRYAGGLPWAVDGVSLEIAPGETVALVGASGAGKSTLGHLLLRFFDPVEGSIRVGGTDLRDLTRDGLSSTIAHVPQDVFLFHDTLRANLVLGAPEASEDALRSVCATATVNKIVANLPEGLDTVVGERGTRLSGGERQRVAIARALLRDCPVLVLDEASSQLDPLSEREIAAALEEVRRGRTTLVIAHRLATIRRADRVVVLDAGVVVATGTHDELMSDESYRTLVASQVIASDPE